MGIFSKKQAYKIVEQHDEGKAEHEFLIEDGQFKPAHKGWASRLGVCGFLSLGVNLILASALSTAVYKLYCLETHETINKKLTYRSFSIDKVVTRLNGSLFPTAHPSWSRLEPSIETDDDWSWFDTSRIVPLSKDDVIKLGKDPSIAAQFPASYNMPEGSYMGAVDLFHKMHCLGELRKKAFVDYPFRKSGHGNENELEALDWIHLRHCTDMLAQDIQCNANLDIQTFEWRDTQKGAYPDFSIERTCTNWDQFLAWSEENALVPGKDLEIPFPPEGAKIVPAQDAYYGMYGFGGSVLYPNGNGWKPNGN